jgi:hypothetical protein
VQRSRLVSPSLAHSESAPRTSETGILRGLLEGHLIAGEKEGPDRPIVGPALPAFLRYAEWRRAYAGRVNVSVSITCDFCGRQVEGEEPPLTWTTSVERGRVRRYCDQCSRAHLRSMEAKLDSEWW